MYISRIFNYKDYEVRVLYDDDTYDLWFVGKDVAYAMGYVNWEDAVKGLCENKRTLKQNNLFGIEVPKNGLFVIPERDVYRLIIDGGTKEFENWFIKNVISEIKKQCNEVVQHKLEEALLNPDLIIRLATELKSEREKTSKLKNEIEQDKPKVLFADAIRACSTSILIGEMAKILKQNGVDMGQNRLFQILRDENYLVSQRGSSWNLPTQKSMDLGILELHESVAIRSNGCSFINKTPKITTKGQAYFIKKFLSNRIKQKEVKSNDCSL